MAFIFADQNIPFAVALVLMLIIAVLEGAATLLGAGISGFLDSLLPEMDMDVDVDMDMPDMDSTSSLTKLLGWLRFGKVPALVILVIFLTTFGLSGFILQAVVRQLVGNMLPALPASGLAFLIALPFVRFGGGILAKIMPKDETDAVSEDSFIGLVAVITLGTAKAGKAAQGKLKDRHGQTHYVMIEPESAEEVFAQGTEVLLVQHHGAFFKAIRNTNTLLGRTNENMP